MRPLRSLLAAAALTCVGALPGHTQTAPVRQVHFDLSPVGLAIGFAVRNSPSTSIGFSAGGGGNWYNYMVVAGRHFSESNGWSYDTKDGSTDKSLYEIARLQLFVRRHFASGRQLDVGIKASGFLHSDSSDDDPGGGTFVGVNMTALWWQWRRLRFGSELDVGRYAESRATELGVNVAPILLRLTFP